ncbi:hypothetical protein [Sphingobacterium siyangense]|uniref:hypothetical protein n=1 Tax=Sphingobacterium siyangense TaxID=459529 RepID=UPI003DA59EEB
MSVNSNTGSVITLAEAVIYMTAYRTKFPNEAKGFFIGSDKLGLILSQEDCIGVRIYNGYDDSEGIMNQVLVGVDMNGDDLSEGIIVEKLVPCPKICSPNSPFNF